MELIRAHQLNIMLMISSVMFMLLIYTAYMRFNNGKAKRALIAMEFCAFIMIVMDRYAYIYRGDVSATGYWMVRISNFLVFLMILCELAGFTRFVIAIILEKGDDKAVPRILYRAQYIILAGVILLVISQFTDLYYSFDSSNRYQRGPFFWLCYVFPIAVFIIIIVTIIKQFGNLNERMRGILLLYPVAVFTCSIFQFIIYGISLNTLSFCIMTVVLFIASLRDLNATVEEARKREVEVYKEQTRNMHELFLQTTEALASAIDAKDNYTHGHSSRVAEYSVRLARMAGKDEEECEEIYFAGILHDVGKIGIPDAIINKTGKLSDEEFAVIKSHPVIGGDILNRITKMPYLSIGAHYHHERYDGKGYPEHLKEEDIPEMARIIAVADAYDAMTSKRSYRDPIPQQKVREEIIKGQGSQFDPKYARLMLELIDADTAYELKEKESVEQLDGKAELVCGDYRENYSNGFHITEQASVIKFNCIPQDESDPDSFVPTLILFDSLSGRIYQDKVDEKTTDYFEYGVIHMDGRVDAPGVRNIRIEKSAFRGDAQEFRYYVKAVRYRDHMLVDMNDGKEQYKIILALPDSSRYVYIALTGQHCTINDITLDVADDPIGEGYIPRIAPKIVYLDLPDGDIPNVEVFNYRSDNSKPVPVTENMTLDFTYRSLPTATRIWHCPILRIFSSDDGCVYGPNYREYTDIRFDGESWSETDQGTNRINVQKSFEFIGWDNWKNNNKQGVHTVVSIRREGNEVFTQTENGGISISNITQILDSPSNLYVSMTGDQCVMAAIKTTDNTKNTGNTDNTKNTGNTQNGNPPV